MVRQKCSGIRRSYLESSTHCHLSLQSLRRLSQCAPDLSNTLRV